jgi:hypothetical protein
LKPVEACKNENNTRIEAPGMDICIYDMDIYMYNCGARVMKGLQADTFVSHRQAQHYKK